MDIEYASSIVSDISRIILPTTCFNEDKLKQWITYNYKKLYRTNEVYQISVLPPPFTIIFDDTNTYEMISSIKDFVRWKKEFDESNNTNSYNDMFITYISIDYLPFEGFSLSRYQLHQIIKHVCK